MSLEENLIDEALSLNIAGDHKFVMMSKNSALKNLYKNNSHQFTNGSNKRGSFFSFQCTLLHF